jgi:F420-dependent oxidoreductase-like protein
VHTALMIEGQEGVTWDQWVELARAAEDAGFQALFRSDHYAGLMGDEGRDATDAWTVIAALSAVTSRIRLGTLVSPVTFRHPSLLAKVVATADHVSRGRVELGMGAGWNEREHAAYGFPFPELGERFERLEEQVEIVRRSWTEDELTFEGTHYRLEAVRALPKPVQAPPTLLLGGQANPRAAALAARFADEYNVVGSTMDDLPARRARLDAACEAVDRDPASLRWSLMTACVIGRDDAEVARRGAALLSVLGQDGDPREFLAARSDRWVVGTVEQARDRLGQLADLGLARVMVQHLVHDDLEMLALMGDELIDA